MIRPSPKMSEGALLENILGEEDGPWLCESKDCFNPKAPGKEVCSSHAYWEDFPNPLPAPAQTGWSFFFPWI